MSQPRRASGGDDVELDGRGHVVVDPHGDLVGAQGLDRVAEDDGALVDLGAVLLDRRGDVGRGDRAEQPAALTRADADVDDTTLELRSEEHTSELQSRENLVCRLLLE